MATTPVDIATGLVNIGNGTTQAFDVGVQGANFLVTNTVGVFMLGMVAAAFGVALVVKLVRGRRSRK